MKSLRFGGRRLGQRLVAQLNETDEEITEMRADDDVGEGGMRRLKTPESQENQVKPAQIAIARVEVAGGGDLHRERQEVIKRVCVCVCVRG